VLVPRYHLVGGCIDLNWKHDLTAAKSHVISYFVLPEIHNEEKENLPGVYANIEHDYYNNDIQCILIYLNP
jgi:hypothetical protein